MFRLIELSLIVFWVVLLISLEIGVYYSSPCSTWNDGYDVDDDANISRIVIIADPQLTDKTSYEPMKIKFIQRFVEFYADIYIRRSFQWIVKKLNADGYWFLGDVMDGGRLLNDADFQQQLDRFNDIFSVPNKLHVAGNHDIGLGDNITLIDRWEKHMAPLNALHLVRNQFLVTILDSLGSEEAARWENNTVNMMEKIKNDTRNELSPTFCFPVIALLHVPLFRPYSRTSCGSQRSAPPIHRIEGKMYKTMMKRYLSFQILNLKPAHIFTGDDHHRCELTHYNTVSETTVPTFSWLQGNPRPAFAMMTIDHSKLEILREKCKHYYRNELRVTAPATKLDYSWTGSFNPAIHVRLCELPRQRLIYFGYFAAGCFSLLVIALDVQLIKRKSRKQSQKWGTAFACVLSLYAVLVAL